MTSHVDHAAAAPPDRGARCSPRRCSLAGLLATTAGDPAATAAEDAGPNRTPPQTLAGRGGAGRRSIRCACSSGDGLAYGQPLPSQQAAAEAYLEDPEVAAVIARRLHSRADGRLIGEVLLLDLDGAEIFDEAVLDAFVEEPSAPSATAPPRR